MVQLTAPHAEEGVLIDIDFGVVFGEIEVDIEIIGGQGAEIVKFVIDIEALAGADGRYTGDFHGDQVGHATADFDGGGDEVIVHIGVIIAFGDIILGIGLDEDIKLAIAAKGAFVGQGEG